MNRITLNIWEEEATIASFCINHSLVPSQNLEEDFAIPWAWPRKTFPFPCGWGSGSLWHSCVSNKIFRFLSASSVLYTPSLVTQGPASLAYFAFSLVVHFTGLFYNLGTSQTTPLTDTVFLSLAQTICLALWQSRVDSAKDQLRAVHWCVHRSTWGWKSRAHWH